MIIFGKVWSSWFDGKNFNNLMIFFCLFPFTDGMVWTRQHCPLYFPQWLYEMSHLNDLTEMIFMIQWLDLMILSFYDLILGCNDLMVCWSGFLMWWPVYEGTLTLTISNAALMDQLISLLLLSSSLFILLLYLLGGPSQKIKKTLDFGPTSGPNPPLPFKLGRRKKRRKKG